MQTSFVINRKDFTQTKFAETEIISEETLLADELFLKIDFFSFTTNNITYAMVGDRIGYWQFFPTEEGWGIIPTWGFAEVIISKHPQIKVGERFYGYYPFATHLRVKAKLISSGFLDVSLHRSGLPIIYNAYTNIKQDTLYEADKEAQMSIFRPLFVTSFLLDDFFEDNQFFQSENIILTGASSKTALGMAYLLSQRNHTNKKIKVIGLTSASNLDFVKSLNLYDQVFLYENVTDLNLEQSYSIVDFAGNQIVQKQLQLHLGNQLKYNCSVGMTHWDKNYLPEHKAPNKPILFFAPTHAQKRTQEWSNEVFQEKLAEAWKSFVIHTNTWLTINEIKGETEIQTMYLEMLQGKIDPKVGYIVHF